MTRRARWATWRSFVVAVAAVGVGGAGSALVSPAASGACSLAAMTSDFDGEVVAVDGPEVTYRVVRVRRDDELAVHHVPEAGGTVVVHYDPPAPLEVGTTYRVKGWDYFSDGISSQIAYDFQGDCGSGEGTAALDGSYLQLPTTDPAGDGWETPVDRRPYVVGGLVVAMGAVLVVSGMSVRRRRRAGR